ncbi:MAG: methyltransferase domain-containing protein [Candidatus Moranbacteria bacterium]|jgi:ubiquinone/menaquinone biosynthesis C-methylase UbiE|nr:methyltransferase domain-containing protein [Candidatus Moranbacteria bacterium]
MQTPAEKYLIKKVVELLKQSDKKNSPTKILNVGAGKSIVIEKSIHNGFGNDFVCDRVDVIDCQASHPVIEKCFTASVESMPEIKSNDYQIGFANYVFEHISDLNRAASEVARVIKPSGFFITSLPNPSAPEFILSKYTPTKFHQIIKGDGEGGHAHETHYAYKNIKEFITTFEKYFSAVEIKYWSNTLGYLYRFPIVNIISKIYDKVVNYFNIKMLMGNVCIVFKK